MSQYAFDPYAPARPTNGLGIAGFVCSLVGLLLTGGLLSPVGLVLSLVALGRRPRGFAVAGVILGALGSCGLLIGIIAIVAMGLTAVALLVGILAFTETEKFELTADMANIALAVEQYKEENRYVPADLTLVHIKDSVKSDPWATPYRYDRLEDGKSFDIVSAGQDKTFDTLDDVKFSRLDQIWGGQRTISVSSDGGTGGKVEIKFGDTRLGAEGSSDGGTVTVEAGGRTMQIKGDEDGGSVDVTSTPPATQPEN